MPAGQVVVVRVLGRLLYRPVQLRLVIFIYEFAGFLALICYQLRVSPLSRHLPNFNRLCLGSRNQPFMLRNILQTRDFRVKGLKKVYLHTEIHMILPSTAFQKVMEPSAVPVMISALLADHVMALIFSLPLRVAFSLASFSRPGLSRSKTLISPSSKLPLKR